MKAAIYARVSDDKKKADGSRRQDVQRQIELLTPMVVSAGDEYELYIDDGKSAFTDDLNQRPAFKQLLNDCRRRFIGKIYIEDLTRFSRKLGVGIQWLDELSALGVHVIDYNHIEATGAVNWTRSAIYLMFSELESRERANKIKSGMAKARNLGKHIGRPKVWDGTPLEA